MIQLTTHPALAAHFDAADRNRIADLQEALSPAALRQWAATPGALYARDNWADLGARGLFSLGIPDGTAPTGRDFARTVAMLSDCLTHDVRSDLDMAIYVHGLVAPYAMVMHPDCPFAEDLLPRMKRGETIACTAYTDADPDRPVIGRKVAGGYYLSGRKWLSVNMPVADHAFVTFDVGRNRHAAIVEFEGSGIDRTRLKQIAGDSLYAQGALEFNYTYVPDANILSDGLRRLRVWNRVMSASRLLNAISACRSLHYLIDVVITELAHRPIAGAPFRDQPQFRKWVGSARAKAAVLEAAIISTLADMAENRIDEARISGLKAYAVRVAADMAELARDMAGGAGTLANSEIAKVATSLSYHKFSGGSEAQLMALYSTSLSRRTQTPKVAA